MTMTLIIRLTGEQIRFLIEETKKKYPLEACGILFGDIKDGEAIVKKIIAADNMLESSTNFQVNPREFLEVLSEAEEEGMQLIGFFHSHPAAPSPSITDIRYMKLWPQNIWLIISSLDYRIEAYQVVADKPQKIIINAK